MFIFFELDPIGVFTFVGVGGGAFGMIRFLAL